MNLLDLVLIYNHLEFLDVFIHRFYPSRLNKVVCNRYLLPQVDNQSLQIVVLCLELSHEQLIIVNLPHEALSLALYDISVLIILLLE